VPNIKKIFKTLGWKATRKAIKDLEELEWFWAYLCYFIDEISYLGYYIILGSRDPRKHRFVVILAGLFPCRKPHLLKIMSEITITTIMMLAGMALIHFANHIK
jgi:hypothetical protein